MKYTSTGGIINVKAVENEQEIVITVSDNGCGISSEDLPRIKEKFFKANVTVRGSGIGLAVADEIIRLHNGTLEINSEENVGTVVTISLPIAKSETAEGV